MKSHQEKVDMWVTACFGEKIRNDKIERIHRFLEEAIELAQSLDCPVEDVHELADYVYGREVGDPFQEVGGVVTTLAALCNANNLNVNDAAEAELARITSPEIMEKIRIKQLQKPKFGPLPGPTE
jgi:hypothetical protein